MRVLTVVHEDKIMSDFFSIPHCQQTPREVQEIDDRPNEMSDALVNYCSSAEESGVNKCGLISFCPQLGLAVETPRDGFTVRSLWEVLNSEL
jgi:hypothetical protein